MKQRQKNGLTVIKTSFCLPRGGSAQAPHFEWRENVLITIVFFFFLCLWIQWVDKFSRSLQSLMSHIQLWLLHFLKPQTLNSCSYVIKAHSVTGWGKTCLITSVWEIIIQTVIQSRSNVPPQGIFEFRITIGSLKRENLDYYFGFLPKNIISCSHVSAGITNLTCHLTLYLHIICKWCWEKEDDPAETRGGNVASQAKVERSWS